MRPATATEVAEWDRLVERNPDGGAILQHQALGQTKGRHGWKPRYFMLGDVAVLVLARGIPGLGEMWYVPNGPGVSDKNGLKSFATAAAALPHAPFLIKVDPDLTPAQVTPKQLASYGYVKAPRNLQYNSSTVIVDLHGSLDDILAGFKQKTRYNIRLAGKKGVTIEAVETNRTTIDQMYALYATTTKRAGVYLRGKSYFRDFWTSFANSGYGQMFFAKYEGQVLAGAFIIYAGEKALYKDGGSVREHTAVQAPYALQWGIMHWLKEQNIASYDMHGVPPVDQIDNPDHALAGLARFKTGFQPEITEFIGAYDLPLDPQKYQAWLRYAERIAVAFEYRVRRRLFY